MESIHAKAIEIFGRIDAVPEILATVCGTTGMGFAAVARVTDKEWVAYAVRDEIDFGLKAGGGLKLDTTICHEIRQSRHAVLIPDTAADPHYCNHHTPRMYDFRSYASYPIMLANGEMWGTLCAIDPHPRDIDRPEIRNLFRLFADLIGFHLNMTGLLELSEANLGAEVATGLQREQFIAVLGHDLRNPLASVRAGITMLRKRPDETRSAMVLDGMEASAHRMGMLIDDILDFSRGRLGEGIVISRQDTDIAALVRRIVGELTAIHLDRAIVIEVEASAPVACDHRRIGQLMSNLIGNAITHGKADEPIRIGSRIEGGALEVYVANGSAPITEEVRAKLFEPFERGGQSEAPEGLGLGLYIVSAIAKAHGGEMTVSSAENETVFTFTMPRNSDGR